VQGRVAKPRFIYKVERRAELDELHHARQVVEVRGAHQLRHALDYSSSL
jgi:hypothetical protein